MKIQISRNDKLVGVYDTHSKAIKTDDKRLQGYIDNGVTTMTGGTRERNEYTEPVVTKPGEKDFFPRFVDRVVRDGYDVDADTLKELGKL